MHKKLHIEPYFRLMRLHQPTGIWLLLWPCWCGVALAGVENLPLQVLFLFAIGAVCMRAAGCIINDIIDRDFDKHVERTKTRPLASGALTVTQAILLLCFLLFISLLIALQMNMTVLILAASSLILVVIYPFMKRITWWPQAFLGITFNWGALLGWAAIRNDVEWPAILLYFSCFFWTLGYDTIYAHQDKIDDIKIGVKSTALRLAEHSKTWITGFYSIAVIGWSLTGIINHNHFIYYLGILAIAAHFMWQLIMLDINNSINCMKLFRSNVFIGLILFASIALDGFNN